MLLLRHTFYLHRMFTLLQCMFTVYWHLYIGYMLLKMSIATIVIKLYQLRVQSRELHGKGVCGNSADSTGLETTYTGDPREWAHLCGNPVEMGFVQTGVQRG